MDLFACRLRPTLPLRSQLDRPPPGLGDIRNEEAVAPVVRLAGLPQDVGGVEGGDHGPLEPLSKDFSSFLSDLEVLFDQVLG